MVKGIAAGIALTLVVELIVAYAVIESGLIPANADGAPSRLETWIARTSLRATIRREAPREANVIALNEQNLRDGLDLYARNCAICHGSAKSNSSPSPLAKGLYPKPPQFASHGVEDDPEGESYWKIKHGIRLTGMPSFGPTLSDPQIWTLALFLKHMDELPPPVEAAWRQVENWPPDRHP
jgi:mono/diheme cytochrome c family protein